MMCGGWSTCQNIIYGKGVRMVEWIFLYIPFTVAFIGKIYHIMTIGISQKIIVYCNTMEKT